MATKHVERLERLRDFVRGERRRLVEEATSNLKVDHAPDGNDLTEIAELQRDFEALGRAIEDETDQEVLEVANSPEP
jgi:hypothetical protein